MGKAKTLKGKPFTAYLEHETYATLVGLFHRLNNEPLKRNELAFVLLENHGLKRIPPKEIEISVGEKIDLNQIRDWNIRLKKMNKEYMIYENLHDIIDELFKRKFLLQNSKREFYINPKYENSIEKTFLIQKINNFSSKEFIKENNLLFIGINPKELKNEEELNKIKEESVIPMFAIKFKKLWIKHNLQKIIEKLPEFIGDFKTDEDKGYVLGCVIKLAEQQIKILSEEPKEFSKELEKIYCQNENYKKVKEKFEELVEKYQEVGNEMNKMLGDKKTMEKMQIEKEQRSKEIDEKIKKYYRKKTSGRYGDYYLLNIFYSENIPDKYKSEYESVKFL